MVINQPLCAKNVFVCQILQPFLHYLNPKVLLVTRSSTKSHPLLHKDARLEEYWSPEHREQGSLMFFVGVNSTVARMTFVPKFLNVIKEKLR